MKMQQNGQEVIANIVKLAWFMCKHATRSIERLLFQATTEFQLNWHLMGLV